MSMSPDARLGKSAEVSFFADESCDHCQIANEGLHLSSACRVVWSAQDGGRMYRRNNFGGQWRGLDFAPFPSHAKPGSKHRLSRRGTQTNQNFGFNDG